MTLRQKIECSIIGLYGPILTTHFNTAFNEMMDEIMNEISKEVYGRPMK